MSKLIEDLKQEHVLILETLTKVKGYGVTSEQGQNMLILPSARSTGRLANFYQDHS